MTEHDQRESGKEGEQFYVTHCTTADSVLNNPGYTVRAASMLDDVSAQTAAFHYPPYELPIDMWTDLPPESAAPRRLARTEYISERGRPRGVWVVHSVYLAKDSVDRDRSYFSHLLLLPNAEPEAVLRSWGASGWTTTYPPGAPKQLTRCTALPAGTLISDAALTTFLSEQPNGPTQLSTTVSPARLRVSSAERRKLLQRLLHALLLLSKEKNEFRNRLYIHAEPGLIALLLYGAMRLLPSNVTNNLTFTTFEPYHRNIRDYKLASVIGTYLGKPGKGLDADLGSTRGFALDTFSPNHSSAELHEALPAGISELVELAIRGEWHLLASLRQAISADPAGLANAGTALSRVRGLARVDAAEATIDELLLLQQDRIAAEELRTRGNKLWPVVKAAALDPQRSDVRTAFSELISQPENVREVWDEATAAIQKNDVATWNSRWSTLLAAAGADTSRKLLRKIISGENREEKLLRLPREARARLRTACGDAKVMPPSTLLVPIEPEEVQSLLTAPPECAGYTAFVLLACDEHGWLTHLPQSSRPLMRQQARDFLLSASPAALAAYVQAARPYLDTDSALLDTLFRPYAPAAAKVMDRLLSSNLLEPEDWLTLCSSVGLTQDEWGEYLLDKERLANLLIGLGGDGEGRDVWRGYLELLTPALISPDLIEVQSGDDPRVIHEWERKVHAHLRYAAERMTKLGMKLAPALPEGGVARLFAANNLLKWVAEPATAERDGTEEVRHACGLFEVEPSSLVRVAYKKGGYYRCDSGTEPQSLAPIVALFKTCFPVDANFPSAGVAVREAVRLSRECPEPRRGSLQALLIHATVPELHYQALLQADWREPLHPYAIARLNEWLSRGVKKNVAKHTPAQSTAAEAVPVADHPFTNETSPENLQTQPLIRKKTTHTRRTHYTPAQRRKGTRVWLWILLLVLIAAASGLIVYATKQLSENKPDAMQKREAPHTYQ